MPKRCPIVKEPCWEHDCEWYQQYFRDGKGFWACPVTMLTGFIEENTRASRRIDDEISAFRGDLVGVFQKLAVLKRESLDAGSNNDVRITERIG